MCTVMFVFTSACKCPVYLASGVSRGTAWCWAEAQIKCRHRGHHAQQDAQCCPLPWVKFCCLQYIGYLAWWSMTALTNNHRLTLSWGLRNAGCKVQLSQTLQKFWPCAPLNANINLYTPWAIKNADAKMSSFGMDVCMETFATLIKFMTSVNWSRVRQKSGMARDKSVVNDTMDEWHKQLRACTHDKGGQFEHLVWFKSPHMLMFGNKTMILC